MQEGTLSDSRRRFSREQQRVDECRDTKSTIQNEAVETKVKKGQGFEVIEYAA